MQLSKGSPALHPTERHYMKTQLVRQCRDTFIRHFGNIGYIINQLTKHDRVYDEAGAVFLEGIDRRARSFDSIIHEIQQRFKEAPREVLRIDFIEFITDLEMDRFVVTGESEEEMDQKEPTFSYGMENPKTITHNFLNQDRHDVRTDTSEFFYKYFQEHPTIFGMEIEVTSRCNERCIHCYLPNKNRTRDIDRGFCIDILNQLKEMKTVQVSFSGGEMFLHQHISDILRHARKNDFMITLLSNGTLLNADIISMVKDININLIQISLYSMRPEEHDTITRLDGSHFRTINAIESLIEADIPVQISCPVMKPNKNSYRDVLLWATENKIKAYTDFIMMARTDFTTSNLDHRLSLEETEKLIKDIIEVDEGYRASLELEAKSKDLEKYATQPICGVGIDNLCMTADGGLYPCAGFQGYILGNAYDLPLKEIWERSQKLKFLRSVRNDSFPNCIVCEARDYCAMCLVRNFNESGGDMFKVNRHFCEVAFLNKRLVEEYKASLGE